MLAHMKKVVWTLRILLLINLVLFVLAFVPAFSGLGAAPGLADHYLGNIRYGGWRADILWVFASTVGIVMIGNPWGRRNQPDKLTRTMWYLWLGCFPVYLFYVFMHMFG